MTRHLKMYFMCSVATKTYEIKCFNTLGFINYLRKHVTDEIYMLCRMDSKLLLFLSYFCSFCLRINLQ